MGILSRLFGRKPALSTDGDPQGMHFYVQCAKCDEKIHVRASRATDIFQDYPDGSERGIPTLHKEILGSRCPNIMFIHITFDFGYHIVESTAERCTLISKEQYEASPL